MTGMTRWSIEELQARYELEPELGDVFVEGLLDRELLSQSPTAQEMRLTFYEIDCVEVSATTLAKYGLTTGNKQRVVALAQELSAVVSPQASVKCIADRDLDHWFGELAAIPRLRWTAFCSIESHFLVDRCIEDILITTGRAKIKKLEAFVESLHVVLRQLYALRLVDRDLGLGLTWPALRKYLGRRADSIFLDLDRYSLSLLMMNKKAGIRLNVMSRHAYWYERLSSDVRMSARGHDFTELLAWAMTEFQGHGEFATPKSIERLFVLLARSVQSISLELQ